MSNPKASSKKKFNPVQLILMPVLGLILVAVLFWPKANMAETAIVASISDSEGDIHGNATQKVKSLKIWPVAKIDDVLAFDPFQPIPSNLTAVPLGVPENTSVENVANAESVEVSAENRIGVLQAIYFDNHGAAAILDSRVIRVGDVLASGVKVVEITAKGIAVE